MKSAGLRDLITRGYTHSVFRRSILLLGMMGPAFVLNFGLYYVAADLLTPENFGLFYVAITTSNVMYSASFVLSLFFIQYFAAAAKNTGTLAAFPAHRRILGLVARWGALGAIVCIAVLSVIGRWVGIQSWMIIILVVLDAYSAYLIDVDRAFLQWRRKTLLLGTMTLGWMTLRFLLSVGGMILFKTAWAGLLGIVLAAAGVLLILALYTPRGKDKKPLPRSPSLPALVPVLAGYVALISVSNLDVLLTYLLLADNALGAYSASSVFPKGIIMVVTPLLQMLYPMMLNHDAASPNQLDVIGRSIAVVFLLAITLAGVIFGLSGWLCGGEWGLRLCEALPLQWLLISAVVLAVLRALVLYQSARGRDWMAITMLIPAAAYLWVVRTSVHSVESIAFQFVIFSIALLIYYGGLSAIARK
jgi:O-antigen/teichoic acid export membrane protein